MYLDKKQVFWKHHFFPNIKYFESIRLLAGNFVIFKECLLVALDLGIFGMKLFQKCIQDVDQESKNCYTQDIQQSMCSK